MRVSMQRLVAASAVVMVAASIPAPGAAASDDDARAVVSELDRCVQKRFARTGKAFGFSRLVTTVHKIHRFVPEDEAETSVLRRLESSRVQVVMYLASRQRPRRSAWGSPIVPSLVQGPAFVYPVPANLALMPDGALQLMAPPPGAADVTRDDTPAFSNLPNAAEMTLRAVESLRALWQRDSHSFDLAGWQFVAQPVRATAASCLSCHNWRPTDQAASSTIDEGGQEPFRLGDPIGAVWYGVRRLPTN